MDETPSIVHVIAYMTILNIGIVISLLSLHEVGHVLIGMYVGCESGKAILFDSSQQGPYAELVCSNGTNYNLAYTGSLMLTTVFGFVFLLLRKSPLKNFFFVVLGFSILFSSLDIVFFTGIPAMEYVFIGLGMVLITIGEFLTGLSLSEA